MLAKQASRLHSSFQKGKAEFTSLAFRDRLHTCPKSLTKQNFCVAEAFFFCSPYIILFQHGLSQIIDPNYSIGFKKDYLKKLEIILNLLHCTLL